MIKRCFSVVLFLFLPLLSATAQDRVGQLLQERDNLYQQYEQYMSQNSSFFGGKSKKDLTNIINTLKGIIAKDNELIREVRLLGAQRQSSAIGQNQATVTRMYDLERELTSLRSQLNTKTVQMKQLQETLDAHEANVNQLRLTIIVLSISMGLLIWYVFRLRRSVKVRA